MVVFYAPDVNVNKSNVLNQTESKHCIQVLRHQQGDIIYLIDGAGGYYKARITEANPKACAFDILEADQQRQKQACYIHIAVAPPKNASRLEWFVEKATEIGISEISPLLTARSERQKIRLDRLQKITIAAAKQSHQANIPVINPLRKFQQFISSTNFNHYQHLSIPHLNENSKHLAHTYTKRQNALVLIGPEGDFSEEEVQLAQQHGFVGVSLGTSRLRTETAALYACNCINLLNS